MKKLLLFGLLGAGLVAFIGADVVMSGVSQVRNGLRESLTSDIPLKTQLAQAHRQIDAYAESIIRGEVAAERLAKTIERTQREVRVLETRVTHQRTRLDSLKGDLVQSENGTRDVVPTDYRETRLQAATDREIFAAVRHFRTSSELLTRRSEDLQRLQNEFQRTVASIQQAKAERKRLSQEVAVLSGEIASLEARQAAARTRKAVGDAATNLSGYDAAAEKLESIRTKISEQNKLLDYYEVEREVDIAVHDAEVGTWAPGSDPAQAIDEALSAYPGR